MKYKIISFVVFFLSMGSYTYAASLVMRVLDADQRELKQVCVGRPFTLEVKVSGVKNNMQEPFVEGLDVMHGRRVGVRMYMINGISSTCYTYEARIDSPGEYHIGPAIIECMQLTSENLTVVAGDEEILMLKKSKNRSPKTNAFLRFEVDEDEVVVGQKISCMLRFYHSDMVASIQDISIPECAGFLKSKIEGPFRGEEKIDTQMYNYIEWRWNLYPQQPGKKMLPACCANFEVQSRRNSFWSGFGALMGVRGESKRVYSNVVHLRVDPLPSYGCEVKAIGSFFSLKSELTPAVVKEGEGAVLVVEIEGEGNFDLIDKFALKGMPQSCKWYESKQFMLGKNNVENNNEDYVLKKRFEFIVQGLQPGHWEIPAQEFVYFDIDAKKYITLKSLPVTMTVLRQVSSMHNTIEHDDSADFSEKNGQKEDVIEDGLSPLSVGPWYPVKPGRSLPWSCFFFILCIPLGLPVLGMAQKMYKKYYVKFLPTLQAKYAFRKVSRKINEARIKKDVIGLQAVFVQFFADRCMIEKATVSPSVISKLLRDAGMPDHDLHEWHDFFEKLARYAFGDNAIKPIDMRAVFDTAELWVCKLRKLL